MLNKLTLQQSCTGLVENYIGSAYDVVKAVAANLDNLQPLFEYLDDDKLEQLINLAPTMADLLEKIDSFNDTYYGDYPENPLTRPSGDAIESGDLYYNSTSKILMIYETDEWIPVSGVNNKISIVEITEDHISGFDATVPVNERYEPGFGNLLVFVNGIFQYPITSTNVQGAYLETDRDTITFPSNQLQVGDSVTLMVGKAITNVTQSVGTETGYYRTAMSGEKLITLPGNMAYIPGIGNLEVYIDGLLQIRDIDYSETDESTVTFKTGLPGNVLIFFRVGSIISANNPILGSDFVNLRIVDTAYGIRAADINTSQLLIIKGHSELNDGGQGVFIYNPLYSRIYANGGTVIDASVQFDAQGSGTGLGCWMRQYNGKIKPEWFGLSNLLMGDLVSLKYLQAGDVAEVTGFHALNDGGQGTFYWKPSHWAALHNGGTVVSNSKDFPANWNDKTQVQDWFTAPASGTGAWVRVDQDNASIAWFGAVGDGVTDNSYVFKGISKAVEEAGLKAIHVPVGEFLFNSLVGMEINEAEGSFRLYGNGNASMLHFVSGASSAPLVFRNCTGLEVTGINFIDSRDVSGTDCLKFMNCSDVLVHRCYFDGIPSNAIEVIEDTIGNTASSCDNIRIENNQFIRCGEGGGSAIYHSPKVLSFNLVIENNYVYYCGRADYAAIYAGMGTFGASIRNNYLDSPLGNGIEAIAYENVSITGNKIEDFGDSAIKVFAGSSVTYNAPTLTYCCVTNNDIAVINPTTNQGEYAISIDGNIDGLGMLLVSQNSISKCAGISIIPQVNLRNIVITQNRVQDIPVDLFGITVDGALGGGTSGLYIADNYIENEETALNSVMVSLTQALETVFEKNHIKRSGTTDVSLTNCEKSHILFNTFYEPNINDHVTAPIIEINDTDATNYSVVNNIAITGNRGNPGDWTNVASAPPIVTEQGNVILP